MHPCRPFRLLCWCSDLPRNADRSHALLPRDPEPSSSGRHRMYLGPAADQGSTLGFPPRPWDKLASCSTAILACSPHAMSSSSLIVPPGTALCRSVRAQTGRQTDRRTHTRTANRRTDKAKCIDMGRQAQMDEHVHRQADRHIDRQTHRQPDRQAQAQSQ